MMVWSSAFSNNLVMRFPPFHAALPRVREQPVFWAGSHGYWMAIRRSSGACLRYKRPVPVERRDRPGIRLGLLSRVRRLRRGRCGRRRAGPDCGGSGGRRCPWNIAILLRPLSDMDKLSWFFGDTIPNSEDTTPGVLGKPHLVPRGSVGGVSLTTTLQAGFGRSDPDQGLAAIRPIKNRKLSVTPRSRHWIPIDYHTYRARVRNRPCRTAVQRTVGANQFEPSVPTDR